MNGLKITPFDDLYPLRPGAGGSVVYVSSGSNGSTGDTSGGGDVVGDPGDYTVVGLRRTVSLASNIGGTTVGDVLTIVQASPRLALFATPSNSGGGTPATTVTDETTWGIIPAVGSDTEYARQDHTHGTPAEPSGGGFGPLLVSDTPAGSPLVFGDLLQNEAGTDLVYADP